MFEYIEQCLHTNTNVIYIQKQRKPVNVNMHYAQCEKLETQLPAQPPSLQALGTYHIVILKDCIGNTNFSLYRMN